MPARLTRSFLFLLSLVGLLGAAPEAGAVACTTIASGSWTAAATWNAACRIAGGNGTDGPAGDDTATIANGHLITTPAAPQAALSLTINTGATATSLTLGGNLTIGGNVVINASSAAVTRTLAVGANTFTVNGNVFIGGATAGASGTNIAQLTVTSGRIVVTGTLVIGSVTVAGPPYTPATVQSVARVVITPAANVGRLTVTGLTTIVGAAAANRDALLTVAAAANAGEGAVLNGGLTIGGNSTTAGAATASITALGGRIAVTGTTTNSDTLSVATGIFSTTTLATTAVSHNATTSVTGGEILVTGNATVTGSTTVNSTASLDVTTGTIDVDGDLTVTGGNNAANRVARARVMGVPAVGRLGLNVDGNLTVALNGGTVTSSLVDITVANGVVNVRGAVGVTNGGTVDIDAGAFGVTNNAATYLNDSGTVIANTRITTGSLTIEGTLDNRAGETVSVTSGSITVGNTITYAGTVSNAGTISMTNAAGVFNANGNFTSSGAFTKTAAATLNLRGATSIINGTFTRNTGTVVMNGNAAQALSGTALTAALPLGATAGLHDLTINNAAGVTLGGSVTVNNTTTFTLGNVTTGVNALITVGATGAGNCATPSVSRTSGHVVGNLQKVIPAAASTCTFEVGTGASYAPAVLSFLADTTTGNMTASTTAGDHGSLGSSSIDPLKSVNRFWTLTNGGVGVPSGFQANFNFVNPGDYDAAGDPAKFTVQRFSAGWNPTTVNSACTAIDGAHLCNQINAQIDFGDFAIGEANYTAGNAGWFNAFETSTGAGVTGKVYTKKYDATYDLDVVAVNALRNGVKANYSTNPITVDVLDASDNSGAINAETGCRSTWTTVLQSTGFSPVWTNSRATVTIPLLGNAKRDVRLRVTQGTLVGCSTDNYAIRPTKFTVTSTNATQTDSTGGPTYAAGSGAFNLEAASGVAGYQTGVPAIDNSLVVGSPNKGIGISGAFSAADAAGKASGSAFTYAEVGNFGLSQYAVFDSTFTAVDQSSDCINTPVPPGEDFRNTPDGSNKIGCKFGSDLVPLAVGPAGTGFGRFIPADFNVTTNSPAFTAGCGTFSYVGKTFNYGATAPVMTVTARNSSGVTTQNYQGVYMKLANASLTPGTQAARYSRFDALGGGTTPGLDVSLMPATTGDPAIGAFANGVGTLTFSSGNALMGEGLAFTRSLTTPNAPFDADIRLAINVIDTDSVASGTVAFGAASAGGGISFGGNKAMRFGRLRLLNASAALPTLPLSIPIQTEYWNGTAFVLNTSDSCTTIVRENIRLSTYAKNLAACETITSATVSFTNGVGALALTAPGANNEGSVNLTPQLGSTFSGKYCTAVGGTGNEADPTPAAKSYLQGNWTGLNYDQNPTGRGAFGVYGAQPRQFIFFREKY